MNSETSLAERIKEVIGQNVSAFARKSGIGESLLRQYIAGSKPGLDKAVVIARIACVPLEWLATGKGSPQIGQVNEGQNGVQPATGRTTRLVPLFKHWRDMLTWVREDVLPDQVSRVETAAHTGLRAFALPVRGKIMEPMFPAGARIIIDPDLPAETDSFVIVKVEGWDEATFRRLVKDAGRTYLEPISDDYRTVDLTDETYTYCGRVVRMEMDL